LFCLREPSEEDVRRFISQQQHSVFSYSEVGTSATDVPSRYNADRNRVFLGRGEGTWRRATEAIREWQMFNMPWVRLYSPTTPIEVGATVAVLVQHFGFYSLNAARIVYVVDEDGPICRYGFAYGTLDILCPGGFREVSRKHRKPRWLPRRAGSERAFRCN